MTMAFAIPLTAVFAWVYMMAMMPAPAPTDQLMLPWATAALWREANDAVACMLRCGDAGIAAAQRTAYQIRGAIDRLDHPMAALCRMTCPSCHDPCCVRATVWYDLKDLIFLHLCDETIPPGQPMTARGKRCRFMVSGGCSLPRRQRPFICTWYLCPEQKALTGRIPGTEAIEIGGTLDLIKNARRRLEDRLIASLIQDRDARDAMSSRCGRKAVTAAIRNPREIP